ncbi:hypothetical protein V8E54_012360 [Elaphomyces granulatus]
MPPSVPPKFVDVRSARSGQGFVNVIGVVADALPKALSSGSSFMVTFTIKDSDFDGESWDGLKVKYFNNKEDRVPDVQQHDVILLRNLRVRPFQQALIGVASQYDNVAWAIFRQGSDSRFSPPICSPGSAEPTFQEKAYANSLLNALGGLRARQSPLNTSKPQVTAAQTSSRSSTSLSTRNKFSLIKDVGPQTFADLIVLVVKTFPESGKFLLYVTDYTVNKSLFNYHDSVADEEDQTLEGDEYGYISRPKKHWQGPFGQMTLQVTLWEPHSYFAQKNVKENDILLLSNVHIKFGREHGRLDASIHTDRRYPDKICVKVVDQYDEPRVKELLKRKREYWKRVKADSAQATKDFGDSREGPQECTKKAKKRRREQQQKKEAKRDEDQAEIGTSFRVHRNELNKNVKAQHPGIPPRSLLDILTNESHDNVSPDGIAYKLPFQNIYYKATVCVIDFFPPNLVDFAVACNPEYAMLSDSDSDDNEEDSDSSDPVLSRSRSRRRRIWEWRFCLLVEDAKPAPPSQPKERLKLFVSGNDAVHLLKLDAVDLRKDEARLRDLREKLFIMWGNLEELKRSSSGSCVDRKQLRALPFTCCIKEYGVKCLEHADSDATMTDEQKGHECRFGWERKFAMFGTTIP